ncbi:MAG: endonuclease III [Acidobacteriota bacterium]
MVIDMAVGQAKIKAKARESERVREILARLAEHYPDAVCALHFQNPFQLLVATILSAQCTDERVNMVTPGLFKRYPDAARMAEADPEELQDMIRSTGFFRNKAKNLIGASKALVAEFGGEVPRSMEELLRLPGVARKTANVVLGTAFGIASGVVVDTHVARVSGRLRLTRHTEPEKIENDLTRTIPGEEWIAFAHRLIHHGRRICRAPKPRCQECMLTDLCYYYRTEVAS